MTPNINMNDSDAINAKKISVKGWRQGSIVDPGGIVTLADGELLIICTQSCTVVSSRFATDPVVEVMAVRPLDKYNPKSFEATGKNQRKLHIEVNSKTQVKCIECDINRRFFLDRSILLEINPFQDFEIGTEGTVKLAGWLGRSYTRIALPDQLVERIKSEIIPIIKKCLDEEQSFGQKKGTPIHESVFYIYIDWQPRSDMADLYDLKLIFLCADDQIEEKLERRLSEKLEPFKSGNDGVRISSVVCRTPDTTFLTDLNGYERFSEWDFLSELGELACAPPRLEEMAPVEPLGALI